MTNDPLFKIAASTVYVDSMTMIRGLGYDIENRRSFLQCIDATLKEMTEVYDLTSELQEALKKETLKIWQSLHT